MKEQEKMQTIIWHVLPFAGIAFWGTLCLSNNLWYDEAYSASMVSQTWWRLLYITATDAHSPFYYILLKLVYHLFGGGSHFQGLKLLSLLFMAGYLFLGKYYVKKLFNRQISVYFLLFSILMPIMCVQAGNVRMYAAALFFLTLTGLSAYDIYLDASLRKWLVFGAASICTMYCHTFAMIQTFFLYILFLWVLLVQKQGAKAKALFRCGIVLSILFSPWLAVTVRQMILRMRYDAGSTSEMADFYSIMDYCKEWFSAVEKPIGVVVLLELGLCIVLCYLAVDWMREKRNYAPAVGMGALGLTTLTGGMISAYVNNCFMGRYVFPGFGFLMLFYAVGMSRICNKKEKVGILTVAAICFVLQFRSELILEYDEGLDVYEQFWEEHVTKEDVMIGPYAHTIFLNVYHPELQYYLYGYKLYSLPFSNTEAFTDWSQLENVGGNIWYITFEGDEPDNMAEHYDYEEVLSFHYMYYDFVIYRLRERTS